MRKGAQFLGKLKHLQAKYPEIGEVDGLGLALRMEMCEADGFTPSRRLADRMFQIGLEGDLSIGSRRIGPGLDTAASCKNGITPAPSAELPPADTATGGGRVARVPARATS